MRVSPNPLWPVVLVRRGHLNTQGDMGDARTHRKPGQPCEEAANRRLPAGWGERPQRTPTLPIPWSQTSSLQSCEKINVFCVSHPPVIFCSGSPSWLIEHFTMFHNLEVTDSYCICLGETLCDSAHHWASLPCTVRSGGHHVSSLKPAMMEILLPQKLANIIRAFPHREPRVKHLSAPHCF